MRLPTSEQLRLYDSVEELAAADVIEFWLANRVVIMNRARRRLSGIGAAEYGDKSWHKSLEELDLELLDELADAVVYAAIRRVMHSI